MSPEAQRIAIADFCKLPPEVTWKLPSSFVVDNENRFLLPDFLNDLNACHEMEKALFPKEVYELRHRDKWVSYRENLLTLCVGNPGSIIRATAAQRCEAFLRTLNLWKT